MLKNIPISLKINLTVLVVFIVILVTSLMHMVSSERELIENIASEQSKNTADTYFDAEEYEKSKESYEKAISIWEHSRLWPSFNNLSRIGFARAKVMNNQKDVNLNELFKFFENSKSKTIEGKMLRYIGEILLNIDDQHMNEAEDWIKKAIEANERNGTRFHLGMSYALYAEFFKRKGELPQAKENLNKAIEILRECGADGWVEKVEEELVRIQ